MVCWTKDEVEILEHTKQLTVDDTEHSDCEGMSMHCRQRPSLKRRIKNSLYLGPAGINSLFPLSRPTLQKGAAQKISVKNFIFFFAIYTSNLVYNHNKRIRMSTGSHIYDKNDFYFWFPSQTIAALLSHLHCAEKGVILYGSYNSSY